MPLFTAGAPTAPSVFPVSRRFIGIGKETTPGTPVAPTSTEPMTTFDPEDKPIWLTDTAWRNAMAGEYALIQGPMIADLQLGGPVYGDVIGNELLNILGDHQVTGTGPYTHTFALLNSGSGQPPTHTYTDYTGVTASVGARVYAYTCLSEVTFTGNAQQLLTWDAKGTSFASRAASTMPTATISTVAAEPSWRSMVGIGGPASGGTLVSNVSEWKVTITRQVDPYYTNDGAQDPYTIARGPLTVTGSLTFSPAIDETPLLNMLSNSQPQLQIIADNGLTGNAQVTLTIDIQVAAYDTSKINAGSLLFGYDVTFKGIANTTNVGASGGYSPIKVTLANNVATY